MLRAESKRTTAEDVELIQRTLDKFDPKGETVAVGTAAMAAQFHQAGEELPVTVGDLDVLCPPGYFYDLQRKGPFMADIRRFIVESPGGRLKLRGASNKSVDIHPVEEDEKRLLKFCACPSMSDETYSMDWYTADQEAITACNIRCLRVSRVLDWLAVIGRDKDLEAVDATLPAAVEIGLVDSSQEREILAEVERTRVQRELRPEIYLLPHQLIP